ncbi:MAG: hypothetical protein ACREHG_09010 [Candidatus Saccharimonadales bacterium]
MPYSNREQRAIGFIAQRNNWRPTISSKPVIFFLDQAGKQYSINLSECLPQYDRGRREDARAKKRSANLESQSHTSYDDV